MPAKSRNVLPRRMKPHSKRLFYRSVQIAFITVTLCSCMRDTRYMSFIPTGDGWSMEDTLVVITDTLEKTKRKSGIELLLRTEGYDYANLAAHIRISQGTTVLHDETINAELRENSPVEGIGKRADYSIPITNLTLSDTTHTTIEIAQMMSDTLLMGIREVGIRIGSPVRHPGEVVWQVEW